VIVFVLGTLAALVAFNAVVMPRFVGHGRDIPVPDLRGKTIPEATMLLAQSRLAVRDTVDRIDPAPPRTVIDQDPLPGRHIKPHRRVRLVVSRGPSERVVPDLAGQTLRFARVALHQENYVLGDVVYLPSPNVERNSVMATEPPAGTEAAPGASVSLLVSTGQAPRTWLLPDVEGRAVDDVAERLRYRGFVVEVDARHGRRRGRIASTDPPAGSVVAEGDTIRIHVD
jgi:serine/threonine-protein kinase